MSLRRFDASPFYLSFFPLEVDDFLTLTGIDPMSGQFSVASCGPVLLLRMTASLAASEADFADVHERCAQAKVRQSTMKSWATRLTVAPIRIVLRSA